MGRHDEMCFLRDVESRLQLMSATLQVAGLIHEEIGSQHHAITNHIHLTTLEDA